MVLKEGRFSRMTNRTSTSTVRTRELSINIWTRFSFLFHTEIIQAPKILSTERSVVQCRDSIVVGGPTCGMILCHHHG